MDENKTYSAEDLLRYAHGQMPVTVRYALEKAALDDPFLAEALEGYIEQANGSMVNKSLGGSDLLTVNNFPSAIPELDELRKIIAEKAADKKEEKAVPVVSIFWNKWLQKAVAAIFLFGTAWWLYSISNKPKGETITTNSKQIAQVQPPLVTDSVTANIPAKQAPIIVSANKTATEQKESGAEKIKAAPENTEQEKVLVDKKTFFANAPTTKADTTVLPSKDMAVSESVADHSSAAKKENPPKTVAVAGNSVQRKPEAVLQNIVVSKKTSFVFKGRVLDANNNPLPFSSVMVPGEDFGTYSDGEGYFNFVYTDSILPVRAKSLGFEPQNLNMIANKKENKIVLDEDKNLDKSLTFLRSEKQKSRTDFKPTIVKVDSISSTVEPFVGWRNYDLYLTNNNRISELPQISNRSVQLSFEVAQDGGIKNITVEKSLGKDLDAEAIRLLKEGPKWKVQKNGGKGKVEVKF